jgi:hypothetical protein
VRFGPAPALLSARGRRSMLLGFIALRASAAEVPCYLLALCLVEAVMRGCRARCGSGEMILWERGSLILRAMATDSKPLWRGSHDAQRRLLPIRMLFTAAGCYQCTQMPGGAIMRGCSGRCRGIPGKDMMRMSTIMMRPSRVRLS